jgi:hypothetical protein
MPYKDPTKKLEWQKKNRQKKHSRNLVEKPVQQESKPIETDCQKFRRLRLSTRKNPDDGFFSDAHLKKCISCQNWYSQHKHEDEWDFKGVNLWGEPETPVEENEQKALEEALKREGFDFKRTVQNETTLDLGLDRKAFNDSNQDFRRIKTNRRTEESEPSA